MRFPTIRRPRFSLRAAFVAMTIAAWCAWQWSISEHRREYAERLRGHGFLTFHNSYVAKLGLTEFCFEQWFGHAMQPIRRSVLGSVIGVDNLEGLTTVIPSNLVIHKDAAVNDDVLDALARLPGLTTLIIYDANPDNENSPTINDFKARLRAA